MARRKNPSQPDTFPPRPARAGIAKRLQRRFFAVFNDKAQKRRMRITSALALPVAVFFGQVHEPPSQAREDGGAAKVWELQQQIQDLARSSHSQEFRANSNEARVESELVAIALMYDHRISEYDAQQLARKFLREVKDPAFNAFAHEVIQSIGKDAYYLQNARENLLGTDAYKKLPNGTEQMRAVMNEMEDGEPLWLEAARSLQLYFILFVIFEMGTRGLFRRGSRRDDKLKQEERAELVHDAAAKLKELLAPKGNTTSPTPPQKRKP